MIEYGAPPAADEFEVTLFGPGYGEAIAVHLGEGVWLLVDSCIDPDTNLPASETYLEKIGVGVGQVHAIVASHWHDDHVRGISRLATKYAQAEFFFSAVFNDKKVLAFLTAYSGANSAGLSHGSKELHSVVRDRKTPFALIQRSIVLQVTLSGRPVMVTALSPVQGGFAQFLAHMAQYQVQREQPINNVPELKPNLESVALHIDLGDDAILLGADLEEHNTCGWSAIMADKWSASRKKSTVFKVAHHGSITGDCPSVWRNLLQANPLACLTPFSKGKVRLPTETDRVRVRGNAAGAYISSGASRRPAMDSRILKRLGDICNNVAQVNAGFGAVRMRRRIGVPAWNVELFGAAEAL